MMLLTPVIFVVAFGSLVTKLPPGASDSLGPLIAVGAIALALFGMLQLMANQFGFDRDGFRVFVLCAASRRDILLGKNLSFAPLALAMAVLLLTVIEVLRPLRLEHFLSMAPQFVSMYLLFCLLTNVISIFAVMPIAAGSLQPAKPKLLTVLLQMVLFTFLFPLSQVPTLLPLGAGGAGVAGLVGGPADLSGADSGRVRGHCLRLPRGARLARWPARST